MSQTGELERMSDIGTVPSIVKTPFTRFNSALNSVRTRIHTEADVDQTTGGSVTEVRNNFRATSMPPSARGKEPPPTVSSGRRVRCAVRS